MEPLATLLKPAQFKVKNKEDPEQLLQDFVEYVELMEQFFTATNATAAHKADHVQCGACKQAKAMLVLIGGKEVDSLFNAWHDLS